MEPSSTFFRRSGALLTIAALIASSAVSPASARGFAGGARVQPIHAAPHPVVQVPAQHRPSAGRVRPMPENFALARGRNDAVIGRGLHRRRFEGAGFALWGSGVYSGDAGQASATQFAAADDTPGPMIVPFDEPACVRPLIIHIKPVARASRLPRVIYGRPVAC